MLIFLDFYSGEVLSGHSFWSMDNPLWYFIATGLLALVPFFLLSEQKKKESIAEAKKIILSKRLEVYQDLYLKLMEGKRMLKNGDMYYYQVFSSHESFARWIESVLQFSEANHLLLDKDVRKAISLINNLRVGVDNLIQANKLNAKELYFFAHQNHKDITEIYDVLHTSITHFFNNISIEYKYEKIAEGELTQLHIKLYEEYNLFKKFGYKRGDMI